jgi:glycosyltransferase involved in cell wall biosynthesis
VASVQKNPALFNRIARAFPDSPFCWMGDGPLASLLEAPNITLTGWLEGPRMVELLGETLVFLSTSSWEGLPFSCLEAMNAGCALLLSDVPGNRDLVRPGENGFLFGSPQEGVDRLAALLRDPERTREMGLASRKMAEEQYSIEQMGEGYRNIYQEMHRTAVSRTIKNLSPLRKHEFP